MRVIRNKAFSLRDNRMRTVVRTAWDVRKGWAHCASPDDKAAAISLEQRGLVTIRRTDELCGGFKEWWVRLTPEGVAATEPMARAS